MLFHHYNHKNFFNTSKILTIVQNYSTPIWIYSEKCILKKISKLKKFDIIRFAQKSCSNINILKIMRASGVKIDAVSLGEIKRALFAGYQPQSQNIIFTADLFDNETLSNIINLKIPVNAGSTDMLNQLGILSPGHPIWLRINPKFGHGHNKKTNTGGENSKHGIWDTSIALHVIKKYNLKLLGLHIHIGSGVDYKHLKKVCHSMVKEVMKIKKDIFSISAGGGLSIPYQIGEKKIDTNHYFNIWNTARNKIAKHLGHKITLEIEPGRYLVAESGILVTQIRVIKKMGNNIFVLVDAGFNDLMRPVMYGSYHNVSIITIDHREIDFNNTIEVIIGGPLCESGDIFTQSENGNIQKRVIPTVKIGDYLIFHDTGAYGASMSSNYNTRPLIPEILLDKNESIQLIRKKQPIEDLLKLEQT
ncbi:diaminopimelate decarboxylase [Buchnera aphidicola (Nipponaphis monzeni)]|uniref:Diaminopimelate decarboxylase n=1 Tax=Buchnera aphidicola (Nipponaphis monzeni) TaxID=2495405 RepID=A0A455TAJ2_9GAMM|nr:diaminopimelate decarboxylase [Buchnera aphidicola]BBI01335.1 diaminopimelate decarboxylase [Buchnera aphidicola (Nipponaphis monzeni)]